jgi:hypothetical protein
MAHEEIDAELEAILDRVGSLTEVLDSLSRIASGKAEHLATNWQDRKHSILWDAAATRISDLSTKLNDPF